MRPLRQTSSSAALVLALLVGSGPCGAARPGGIGDGGAVDVGGALGIGGAVKVGGAIQTGGAVRVTAGARPGTILTAGRSSTQGPVAPPPAADVRAWRLPVENAESGSAGTEALVARRFELPESSYGPGHRGVDLWLGPGSPVLAPQGGVVTYRGVLAGRGVLVLRHDDGLRSTLEPLTSDLVVGARVDRGAVVGALEERGSHCEPRSCLHWGVRLPDGSYVDPLVLVHHPRAVLLPTG